MKNIVVYENGRLDFDAMETMSAIIASIPGAELLRIYWDRDESRDHFRAMQSDVEKGGISAIVTPSIRRFAPDVNDCLDALRTLHQHGCTVFFAKEHTWSGDVLGQIMLTAM